MTTTNWNEAINAVPKTEGNYFKPEKDHAHLVRVMSPPVFGYEYWNQDGKPVRSKEMPQKPADCRPEEDGKCRINFFWAFVIWNYEEERLQIWQVTQKTIMRQMEGYIQEEEYGVPQRYDLKVTREGEKFETKYHVIAMPPKDVKPEVKQAAEEATINLDALFTGDDPFSTEKQEDTVEDVVEENSPFEDKDIAANF